MTVALDFWHTWWKYRRQSAAVQQRMFGSRSLIQDLRMVLTVAPVVENHGFFEFYDGAQAPKSFWRWIIAVRSTLTGDPLHDGDMEDPAQREALFGFEIEDIVACSQDLTRVTSRLLGSATVLGWPQEPILGTNQRPIRVRESPLAWLLARGSGVAFCGGDLDVGNYLRQCEWGVVVPTLPMGEAMEKKMKRAGVARPRILVDA